MRKGLSGVLGIMLLALLLVQCSSGGGGGGDGSTPIGAGGGVARSSDGRLTLTFPAGALGEETAITITRLSSGELPPELRALDPGLAYELGPPGLVPAVPIVVSLELAEGPRQPGGFLVELGALYTSTGEGVAEPLGDVVTIADWDTDTTRITGLLVHFSALIETRSRGVTVSITGVPDEVETAVDFYSLVRVHTPTSPAFNATGVEYTDHSSPNVMAEYGAGGPGPTMHEIPETPGGDPDTRVFTYLFEYVCYPEGSGVYDSEVAITATETIPGHSTATDVLVRATYTKTVACVHGAATSPDPPPPPPAPPAEPGVGSDPGGACSTVAGDYTMQGTFKQDPFGNAFLVGNPCYGGVVIAVETSGSSVSISGPPPLVTTTGTLIPSGTSCGFETSGTGTVGGVAGTEVGFAGAFTGAEGSPHTLDGEYMVFDGMDMSPESAVIVRCTGDQLVP